MAETPTSARAVDPLDGVQFVDCDAHFTEPPDVWTSRVPASLKDKVPVQKTVDGNTAWYLDGELWASIGGNTISGGRQKVLGSHVVQPFEAVDPAAWTVSERLSLLDTLGIEAQIVYPNGIGFASNHVFAIEDEALRIQILQTYNDFFADIQEESGNRLLPQGILPVWDMDLTVKEMERLLARGMRGFTLSDKPELIGLPELPDPYFEPMWDLFAESGAVPNFHIGSGARREDMEAIRGMRNRPASETSKNPNPGTPSAFWYYLGHQRRLAVHATQMFMSNVRIIANLTMSDIFDRFPKLKIVSAESGIGWVPFILETLEYQYDEGVTNVDEVNLAKRRPTDYFRDHIYVMFWYEHVGPTKLIQDIGVNNVLVETDVPHPTCLYPGTRERLAKSLTALDANSRRRVLHDNAAELYGIGTPKK